MGFLEKPQMEQVVLVIPAYKPSAGLVSWVDTVMKNSGELFCQVVIIDDGSGLEHRKLFQELRERPLVTILEHAINLGKGAALKTGFNHTLIHQPQANAVVTADADGQHAPHDVAKIAGAAIENPGCLVLGYRQFSSDVPMRSRLGNLITVGVFRLLGGMKIKDTQTGLRAWPKKLCLEGLRIALNGYNFEMENLVRSKDWLAQESKIVELPIDTIYLDDNQASHFNPILDSMRIYFVLLRYFGASLVAFGVDNVVFMISKLLGAEILTSQVVARTLAVLVVFTLLRCVVFNSDARWQVSLTKYLMLVFAFGAMSYAAINFLHDSYGVNVLAAKLLAEAILFLAGFAISRLFIFNK
jgi:glycosyltransferase involved in cell wall biosynthesis